MERLIDGKMERQIDGKMERQIDGEIDSWRDYKQMESLIVGEINR